MSVEPGPAERPIETPESQLSKRGCELLAEILKRMDIAAQVTTREDAQSSIVLDITAADLGLVIGTDGETINALQTLVRAITVRENVNHIPILLDGQGYRSRQDAALMSQAHALGRQVKQTRKEAVLEGLTSY